jgi:hypothetical protein
MCRANPVVAAWPRWHEQGFKLALLVALPQLPFWVSQSMLAFHRPVFNLDLLLASALATLSAPLGALALALAWLVDVARIASLNYHFASPLELLAAVRFADLVSVREIVSWKLALGLASLLPCGWITVRAARSGRALGPGVLAVAVLLQMLDLYNGSGHLFGWGGDRFRWGVNLAGSPAWNILQAERAMRRADVPVARFDASRSYRRLAALAHDASHADRSVLLVVVESMGLPQSRELQDWLGSRLDTPRLRTRYQVERQDEPFVGTTTYGELRVLCGLRGHYSRLQPHDHGCVPQAFADRGWQALGLHGFGLDMFDRKAWWPRVGLLPQPLPGTSRHEGRWACNVAFPGWCDGVVLHEAVRLAQSPRRFVYALTLDTHLPLPVDRDQADAALAALCRHQDTPDAACQLVAALGSVLGQLEAELATAPTAPHVVVVGDHSPPFVTSTARSSFSVDRVPLFVLTPRDEPVAAK